MKAPFKTIVVELHPPMLNIGQNLGKIANYPPNAQHNAAPLIILLLQLKQPNKKRLLP